MGKTIVIANQKGGVGKTTTAINLSACIAAAEKRTLLIDNDPQANATSGTGVTAPDKGTIYEVLVGEKNINDVIVETQMPFLWVIPSHINLTGAEIELVELENRERLLWKALEPIRDKFDFIIIDCPPSLGLLTLNALTAADSVLIPVQCEYFALEGLGQLFNTINMVKKTLNPNLDIEGVLLTMYDSRLKLSHQIVDEVKRYFGDKVFKTIVSRNIRLSEAPSFGQPIILYDAVSSGARHHMDLAKEILANNSLLAADHLVQHQVS
jgi:chromosome partitioning protein